MKKESDNPHVLTPPAAQVETDIQSVLKVLKSGWLRHGALVETFEKDISKAVGATYSLAVSNSTAALHLACLAAGISSGDYVIVTPLTLVASVNAVLYCGAEPLFADVDWRTGLMSPDALRALIREHKGKKIKAVIPFHLGGNQCALAEIYTIAKENELTIIEDASHALGARYALEKKWYSVGDCRYSDMTVLGFYPEKAIMPGKGGAITTHNASLLETLRTLRSRAIVRDPQVFLLSEIFGEASQEKLHGVLPSSQPIHGGVNYQISDIQCALGRSQLKHVAPFLKKRKSIAARYTKDFDSNKYFMTPRIAENCEASWHVYSLQFKDEYVRALPDLFRHLRSKCIGVQKHYLPVYMHPYYKKRGFLPGLCPNAEKYYAHEMSIPLFHELTEKSRVNIVETVLELCDDTFK
jgi:dTDP-4-amino-4,6-dideoxygalactose transaminase